MDKNNLIIDYFNDPFTHYMQLFKVSSAFAEDNKGLILSPF